jgi:hypothetical protein
MQRKQAIDSLYDLVTGDEDARVCKDIPEEACDDQPRNYFAYLVANLLNKVGDELASARLVLPWLLGALGAPAAFTGFLVPIREAGVLLPQLAVAAYVRHMPVRKGVWLVGASLTAFSLALMALAAITLEGAAAGVAILALLVVFSLSRGLCSVSAKDVLGKTVSKSRRGSLMGYSAGIAGVVTVAFGAYLEFFSERPEDLTIFFVMLLIAMGLWMVSVGVFALIREQPGYTEGGGNALSTALHSLGLLRSDPPFRHFLITRALLLGLALAPPFLVLMAQAAGGGISGLGLMIIASGLAGSLTSPVWGRLGDRSSRLVMVIAAVLGAAVCILIWLLDRMEAAIMSEPWTYVALFAALAVFHSGVRLGRKVYLVDLATERTRAAYVAVSNTLIGVMMLFGGLIGVLGDLFGPAWVLLLLGLLSLAAGAYAWRLPEVSEPQ